MPTYNYKCNHCDYTFEKILKIDDRKTPELDRCPNCVEIGKVINIISSPKIVSGVGSLMSKTDSGWKEVLSKVKESHTINNIKT